MVIQYPHIGKVYMPAAGVITNGNLSAGSSSLEYETMCRYEPNIKSQFIIGQDGEKIGYRCIVYMPLPKLLSSSITGDTSTSIYAGERILYDVPADLEGTDTALVPEINGRNYWLAVDGKNLKKDVDYEEVSGGFKLLSTIAPLRYQQRFEIQIYYSVTTTFINGVVASNIDYPIKPGSFFEVWKADRLIVRSKVLQFYDGQLNMRVWL